MKKQRNLDGMYYRVEREGKWLNICFSDLTEGERQKIFSNIDDIEYLRRVCAYLADRLYAIGEQFDLVGEGE